MPRRVFPALAAAVVLFLAAAPVFGQMPTGREEVQTKEPRLGSILAMAPIPPELHLRNEGGRDGAGLCVPTSLCISGAYQRVPGLEGGKSSALWKAVKADDGGYYPAKLEAVLHREMPDEEWASWEAADLDLVRVYLRKGIPVNGTLNTGELYGWQGIHHYVCWIHLDDAVACYVDNNEPGVYRWITAAEAARRFPDGGKGWGFVWLRLPNAGEEPLFIVAAALLSASATVVAVRRSGILFAFAPGDRPVAFA